MDKDPDLDETNKNKPKLGVGTQVLFGVLGVLLFVVVAVLWLALNQVKLPPISVHGWIAMSLGIGFSLLIGCGLMWLSFYSSREGFDDRADPGRLKPPNDRPKP